MLINLLGLIEIERIEKKLEKTGQITLLKGYLVNVKDSRNTAAHTHLKGVTSTHNAPSRTINDFNRIRIILEHIDKELRNK